MIVSCIVEGHGEIDALPVLLRRLAAWKTPDIPVTINRPARLPKGKILHDDKELRRHLELAASKCGQDGWILVLFDSDQDCPMQLAESVGQRATQMLPHRRISIVVANCEYEAWFIAGSPHNQIRDFPEDIRDAKGWVARNLLNGHYDEILHQPRFSQSLDLDSAYSYSRSFRKLCAEWERQVLQTFD
jgi:hypothetical protein